MTDRILHASLSRITDLDRVGFECWSLPREQWELTEGVSPRRSAHVVLIGFGPAGQAVAAQLRKGNTPLVLIEWNPALARAADAMGIDTIIGDATRTDVLSRACVGTAKAVAITVPDPTAARTITAHARAASSDAIIVARSPYQRWNEDLLASGATSVSDEEPGVGVQVAYELRRALDATEIGPS